MKVMVECPFCVTENHIESDMYEDPWLDIRKSCKCCEKVFSIDLEPSFDPVCFDSKLNH